MIELRRVRGALDDEQLAWISRLYGPVDEKYRSLAYLRHQFVGNPFGWSAHVFALADGEAVGHCGVIPFRARLGAEPFTAGKLEALAIAEGHRGRRPDTGTSLALDLLSALYAYAVEEEVRVLFGFAPPRVAAIHVRAGCRSAPVDAPAFVHVARPRVFAREQASRTRRLAAYALAGVQRAAVVAAPRARLGPVEPADGALAEAERVDGAWTVSGADAWDWYAGSGVLRAVEVPGRFGSRAIVRLDGIEGTAVQLVAWRPRGPGVLPAILLLAALARIARTSGAPTLRVQSWRGEGGDGALARACRLLGFVRRPEADLVLYSRDPAFAAAEISLTPFFYVTF